MLNTAALLLRGNGWWEQVLPYCLLPTAHYLLPAACCLLPTAHCPLPTAYCLLPAAYCLLPAAYCLLPTAHCLLPTAHCPLPTAYCLLPAACCLLPTAYCLPPTAYCLLPAAYCLLLTAYCLLPTTYQSLLLPTTTYQSLSATLYSRPRCCCFGLASPRSSLPPRSSQRTPCSSTARRVVLASGRAGHPRPEVSARLRTVALCSLWDSEQCSTRPPVTPRSAAVEPPPSLSEAPPKVPTSLHLA